MTRQTELQIMAEMAKYQPDDFDLYNAEAGWQDWMNEYTTAEDGQECSDRECMNITDKQKELWKEAHKLTD